MDKITLYSVLSRCDDLGFVQQWFLTEKEADDQTKQLDEEGFEVIGGETHEVPIASPESLVDWLNENAYSALNRLIENSHMCRPCSVQNVCPR